MKTYHQPRWANEFKIHRCKHCDQIIYGTDNTDEYCSTDCHEKAILWNEVTWKPSYHQAPVKAYAEMEDYEFAAHKRKYGSCIDEERGFKPEVDSHDVF